MPKEIKKRLIKVIWHDACSRAGWQDKREITEWIKTDKGYLCDNIGWLVEEDKDFLIICARKTDYDKTYGLCEKLPKSMIKKVVQITET